MQECLGATAAFIRDGASSDVQNSKILELSGVQVKAMSLFVRIDIVCQS
jgi:hypothetical protein